MMEKGPNSCPGFRLISLPELVVEIQATKIISLQIPVPVTADTPISSYSLKGVKEKCNRQM